MSVIISIGKRRLVQLVQPIVLGCGSALRLRAHDAIHVKPVLFNRVNLVQISYLVG